MGLHEVMRSATYELFRLWPAYTSNSRSFSRDEALLFWQGKERMEQHTVELFTRLLQHARGPCLNWNPRIGDGYDEQIEPPADPMDVDCSRCLIRWFEAELVQNLLGRSTFTWPPYDLLKRLEAMATRLRQRCEADIRCACDPITDADRADHDEPRSVMRRVHKLDGQQDYGAAQGPVVPSALHARLVLLSPDRE